MTDPVKTLCRRLGYDFKDADLIKWALTHRSAGSPHNERLEFLGDGILNFVVALALFERFPSANEGELSRLRATLVKQDTLAKLARNLKIGDALQLGSGELKSGGFRRDSILADALEAIFGAVYLDRGFDACRQLILHHYAEDFALATPGEVLKDPKTRLQEVLQSRKIALPQYRMVSVTGEAHEQTFRLACAIPGLGVETEGIGSSRRKAEQEAAAKALVAIEERARE